MIQKSKIIIKTDGYLDVTNITPMVMNEVKGLDVRDGNALLFCAGSTAVITSIEFEPGLKRDIKKYFDRLFPHAEDYAHNIIANDDNGASHLLSALIKPSFSFPVIDGVPILGKWQQIVFIECDMRARTREILLQIVS
ncbi:MAG: YjbQ family protein [Spirochaetes bacterium]|nr:YjbQ family protein [Spirochaetota bacterium]